MSGCLRLRILSVTWEKTGETFWRSGNDLHLVWVGGYTKRKVLKLIKGYILLYINYTRIKWIKSCYTPDFFFPNSGWSPLKSGMYLFSFFISLSLLSTKTLLIIQHIFTQHPYSRYYSRQWINLLNKTYKVPYLVEPKIKCQEEIFCRLFSPRKYYDFSSQAMISFL